MEYMLPDGRVLPVLSGLDVTVSPAEVVCLAGRSGSGKTTAIMIAAGLVRPTSGSVLWESLEISQLGPDQVTRERGHRIGVVFQNAALIGSLRAAENVALAGMTRRRHRADRGRIRELLHSVGLSDHGDRYPSQLSGGEQQRVALARALYHDPPLLLIDEPTANLDRTTADGVLELMRALRSDGRAQLVASHDQSIISAANRVVELD